MDVLTKVKFEKREKKQEGALIDTTPPPCKRPWNTGMFSTVTPSLVKVTVCCLRRARRTNHEKLRQQHCWNLRGVAAGSEGLSRTIRDLFEDQAQIYINIYIHISMHLLKVSTTWTFLNRTSFVRAQLGLTLTHTSCTI